MRQTRADVAMFTSRTRDMADFSRALANFRQDLDAQSIRQRARVEDVEELLQIQAKGIEKCQGLALASVERQATQDEAIANFRAEIAENHTKMEAKFNEWFTNLEGEQDNKTKQITTKLDILIFLDIK